MFDVGCFPPNTPPDDFNPLAFALDLPRMQSARFKNPRGHSNDTLSSSRRRLRSPSRYQPYPHKLRLPAPSSRRQAVTAIRAASPRRVGISKPQ